MERVFLPFPREQGQAETAQLFKALLIPFSGGQVLFSPVHKHRSQQLFSLVYLFPQGIPILSGSITMCSRESVVFHTGIGTWFLVGFGGQVSHSFFATYGDLQRQKGPHCLLDNLVPVISELAIKPMLCIPPHTVSPKKAPEVGAVPLL